MHALAAGDDGDRCQAVDEICADCEEAQGEGDGHGVLHGRAKKCSGGQPLPSTSYTHSGVSQIMMLLITVENNDDDDGDDEYGHTCMW